MGKHVNSVSGAVGVCRAKVSCPFGDIEAEHFSTNEAAVMYAERLLEPRIEVLFTPLEVDAFLQSVTIEDEYLRRKLYEQRGYGPSEMLRSVAAPKPRKFSVAELNQVKEFFDESRYGDPRYKAFVNKIEEAAFRGAMMLPLEGDDQNESFDPSVHNLSHQDIADRTTDERVWNQDTLMRDVYFDARYAGLSEEAAYAFMLKWDSYSDDHFGEEGFNWTKDSRKMMKEFRLGKE